MRNATPAVKPLDSVPSSRLRKLHRGAISDRSKIVELLDRLRLEGGILNNGVDRKSEPRTAKVVSVGDSEVRLSAPNLRAAGQPQLYLHFDFESTRYFFAAPPISGGGDEALVVGLPSTIYEAERRDLLRKPVDSHTAPSRVAFHIDGTVLGHGVLTDWSYQGMGVELPADVADSVTDRCVVRIEDGPFAGDARYAIVRRRTPQASHRGWKKLGLEVSAVDYGSEPFCAERRERVLQGGAARHAWRRVSLAGAMAKRLPAKLLAPVSRKVSLEPVAYPNSDGDEIRGIVDRALGGEGGVAVVIPPAWGRTKETFLALARTITATFEKADMPVAVLRFDGTHRRGESYVDPECRAEGQEYLRFTFSQAVSDIRSSIDFARQEFKPKKVILVSFSLGSIEARRAAALEARTKPLDGWISVVGMVDLQSGLRTVSGGLDFAYGQSMGVEFGHHELVGVVADMDHTGRDAFDHNMVFLEDAKRDMAGLDLPITWIHGRYDAWMELDRVEALMSAGPRKHRRLIEIPSGHQMRSSAEAIETFQLVSTEAARMCLGRASEPAVPDLVDLEERTKAERARRPLPDLNRARFWSDYLLGRDRRLGFELMSATSPYRGLMRTQIDRLRLLAGERVVDLGGGTGDFAVNLAESGAPQGLRVTQVDLVPEALKRSRDRLRRHGKRAPYVNRIGADLEVGGEHLIPMRSGVADAVLGSLLVSYVEEPGKLIGEISRILRPGGRLVLSSMRRDADISRIYVNSLAELPPDRRRAHFGDESAEDFEELQRVFLNDAAKLLQLEEEGLFRFYDGPELSQLVASAGFQVDSVDQAFGEPAQAVVVTARKSV